MRLAAGPASIFSANSPLSRSLSLGPNVTPAQDVQMTGTINRTTQVNVPSKKAQAMYVSGPVARHTTCANGKVPAETSPIFDVVAKTCDK